MFLLFIQLVLTVLLLSIIVYLYTVIAFNFFRKFYVKEGDEEGAVDYKCHDMFSVSSFYIANTHFTVVPSCSVHFDYSICPRCPS